MLPQTYLKSYIHLKIYIHQIIRTFGYLINLQKGVNQSEGIVIFFSPRFFRFKHLGKNPLIYILLVRECVNKKPHLWTCPQSSPQICILDSEIFVFRNEKPQILKSKLGRISDYNVPPPPLPVVQKFQWSYQ